MEWEEFVSDFRTILSVKPELTAIRLELYLSTNRRWSRVALELMFLISRVLLCLFIRQKKIRDAQTVKRVYLIDSSAPSCVDNIHQL